MSDSIQLKLETAAMKARTLREGKVIGKVGDQAAPKSGAQRFAECACGNPVTQTYMVPLVDGHPVGWFPDPPQCERCSGALGREAEIKERQRQEEQERAVKRLKWLEDQFQVPKLHRDASLENFHIHGEPEHKKAQRGILTLAKHYVEEWPNRQNLPCNFPLVVAMTGKPGTGKGHVSFGIGKDVLQKHRAVVRRVKMPELVREIHATYNNNQKIGESDVLRPYREADLLIIDEVSRQFMLGKLDSNVPYLYAIIDWREEAMRPTIMTSNEANDEAALVFGDALIDRIERYAGFWHFNWPSYRVILGDQMKQAVVEDIKRKRTEKKEKK